jgi:hypothetical protein
MGSADDVPVRVRRRRGWGMRGRLHARGDAVLGRVRRDLLLRGAVGDHDVLRRDDVFDVYGDGCVRVPLRGDGLLGHV